MAGRLPVYGAGVAASADRRVINIPVPNMDTGEGAALRSVGNAVSEFGQRIEKAKNDRELLTADRKVRESLDRLRFDIEQTPNDVPDEKLRQRYDEESERIIQAAGGQIGNAGIRDMWTERAKGWQGEGALWTDQLGRKRSVDRVRAGHVSAGAEIEAKAGDPALTRETIEAMVSGEQAAIRRAGEIGIYSPEEAAAKIAAMDRIVTKDASIRFSANINEMVKQGRVAEAQAYFDANNASVDPQTRETVKAGLQASQQEFAVVEKGDDIWLRAAGNYGKAIELAADIKDAPLRLKVEARLNQKHAMVNAALEQEQEGYVTQLWDHVRAGGKIANAPPSLMGSFDKPVRFASVQAFENARDAEARMSAESKTALREESKALKDMFLGYLKSPTLSREFMKPESEWPPGMFDLYRSMRGDDQLEVSTAIEVSASGGKTADDVTKTFNSLMRVAQIHGDPAWLLGSESVDALENNDNRTLTKSLMEAAGELSAQYQGQPVPQKELEIVVGNIFMTNKPKARWLVPKEFGLEAARQDAFGNATTKGSAWAASSGIDWTLWNKIKAALPPEATADDVEAEYLARGGKLP